MSTRRRVPALERESLVLWFCPACGGLVNNTNYVINEGNPCRGKIHQARGVPRRYAPLETRTSPSTPDKNVVEQQTTT